MKTYLLSYPHNGARWSAEIQAESHEDAEARLKMLAGFGRVDGELVARVPGVVPVPLFVRFMNWLRR